LPKWGQNYLPESGVPPVPLEVYDELRKDPDLPRPVSHDAVPLASLMEAAPHPRHAPAYAAMVVDGGIRQRIGLAGSRMAQAGGDPGADLDAAFSVVGQARRELDACRARWEALPGPVRRELPAPHRDDGEYAEAVRRAKAVRDEIGRRASVPRGMKPAHKNLLVARYRRRWCLPPR